MASANTTRRPVRQLTFWEKFKSKKYVSPVGADLQLILTTITLSVIGFLTMASASASDSSIRTPVKQIVFFAIGFAVMFIASQFDYSFFRTPLFYHAVWIFGVVAMAICLIANWGNDISRTLNLKLFTLEPSEILKFGIILFIGFYAEENAEALTEKHLTADGRTKFSKKWRARGFNLNLKISRIVSSIRHEPVTVEYFDDSFPKHLHLAFATMIPLALILKSSHLSAAIIYSATALFCLFLVCKAKYLIPAGVLAALAAFIYWEAGVIGYQHSRVNNFSWQPEYGTQSANALYAICSGGMFGKGYTNSVEKFGYVAEKQNDFIFSILCEEGGFISAIALIVLFSFFIYRIYKTGKKAETCSAAVSACGIAIMFALQVFFHIGVNLSILPNTGISLPFFSSGGSALIVAFAEVGLALSFSCGTKYPDRNSIPRNAKKRLQR